MFGNFFDILNTTVCAKVPQKMARHFFGQFSIFVDFLPKFEDFKTIFAIYDNLQQRKMLDMISIVE